jgi:Protein of unknown function (DUF4235)
MKLLVKLLYLPFGVVFGAGAGLVATRLYRAAWGAVDDREPPSPTTERTTWGRVLGAAALRAVTFEVTRAAADRAGAQTFSYLFGAWPGKPEPEPEGSD